MRVAEHLDFDVARALHVFFDQHGIIAKAVGGFALATVQRGDEVFRLVHRAHALAAAARAGLDQHRVADAVGLFLQQRRVLIGAVVARHQRHLCRFHQSFGFGLQTHRVDGAGGRADEDQPRVGAGLGEVFVLTQKPVAGVNGLRASLLGSIDDALPLQVTVFGRAAAHVHRLVARHHVLGVRVGVGIHRHGLDAHAARGACHAASDFATVGDQDFLEHVRLLDELMPCRARVHRC